MSKILAVLFATVFAFTTLGATAQPAPQAPIAPAQPITPAKSSPAPVAAPKAKTDTPKAEKRMRPSRP